MEKQYVPLDVLNKIIGGVCEEMDKKENQISLIPTEEASKLIKKIGSIAESAAVPVEESE